MHIFIHSHLLELHRLPSFGTSLHFLWPLACSAVHLSMLHSSLFCCFLFFIFYFIYFSISSEHVRPITLLYFSIDLFAFPPYFLALRGVLCYTIMKIKRMGSRSIRNSFPSLVTLIINFYVNYFFVG